MKLKYFDISEFDSPDKEGSGKFMQPSFLAKLEEARAFAKVPFVINSGFRTKAHNKAVGGVENSSHTKGWAVDIRATTSAERFVILSALMRIGFNRIGIANSFIHVDMDPNKPANVIWKYA